jgi:hypothetical protein
MDDLGQKEKEKGMVFQNFPSARSKGDMVFRVRISSPLNFPDGALGVGHPLKPVPAFKAPGFL